MAGSDASTLWSGGETLAVSAAGGVAPAFDLSMKAPAQIVLTAPVLTGTPLVIARGADMSVTWTGGTAGTLFVIELAATDPDHAYIIECTFDAAAGNGTIPAAAFTDTPTGDGILNAYGRSKSATTSDGWAISATASTPVLNASGAYVNGHVTFQ
jgi:hypothetical protein